MASPGVRALVACLAGRGARLEGARWFSGRLQFMLACLAALALLVFLSANDMALPERATLGGLLLGAMVAPAVAFYALGYAVRRGRLAGALWFVGTLPLAAYSVIALAGFIDYTLCAGWDCQGGFD